MSYDAKASITLRETADVRKLLDAGVPAKKICLGRVLWTRIIRGDQAKPTRRSPRRSFRNPPLADDLNGMYFNGLSTIRAKIRFASDQKLGGAMIWEIGQTQRRFLLLKVIAEETK